MQVLEDGETVLFTVTDNKTYESGSAHLQTRENYGDKAIGALGSNRYGTTYQRYIWTEKLDSKNYGKTKKAE